MIKLTGGTILASLAAFAAATPSACADVPVIDIAALTQWAQELQQQAQQLHTAMNQLTQLETTVRDIEDIPRDLMGQVQGLMQVAVQNPLQGITGNLAGLFNGSGTGQCAGAANLLAMNQFHIAQGGDFLGSWINGGASVTAGLQACTNMVLQSTQTRLNDLPQLVSQLQSCNDMACATAVNGRIQEEVANINAQTLQQSRSSRRWTHHSQHFRSEQCTRFQCRHLRRELTCGTRSCSRLRSRRPCRQQRKPGHP